MSDREKGAFLDRIFSGTLVWAVVDSWTLMHEVPGLLILRYHSHS